MEKNRDMENVVSYFLFMALVSGLMILFQGCTLKVGIDWHGETGKSDTTVSKDFVETKKPITERRY